MESFEPRLILVPTDLSEAAAHALRYASALGERLGAHLLVIYANTFIPPIDFMSGMATEVEVSRDTVIGLATSDLRKHAEQNIRGRVAYDLRVIVDEPLHAIVAQARESGANLVVMGTHGRTGMRRLMFGSVTEAVMRVIPVPVIAVNPSTKDTADVEKILCPVTFTPACRDALRDAAALSRNPNARIVLLGLSDDDDVYMTTAERLRGWMPPELADRCDIQLVSGPDVAEQIVMIARTVHADLIAFGIPAGRSVAESLRGTMAERVVQQSNCPVLTVSAYAAHVLPLERERELVFAR